MAATQLLRDPRDARWVGTSLCSLTTILVSHHLLLSWNHKGSFQLHMFCSATNRGCWRTQVSLCRTLTSFLISVSNNMLTFQRWVKRRSADQQQGEMWGVTDCNFTVNTKAVRVLQCHLRGEESFNRTVGSHSQRLHGAHVRSGRVVMAGLRDGRRLHTHTHWDRLTSNLCRMWGCLSRGPGCVVSLSALFQPLCRWFALLFDCFVSVCCHFAARCCRVVYPCCHFWASL